MSNQGTELQLCPLCNINYLDSYPKTGKVKTTCSSIECKKAQRKNLLLNNLNKPPSIDFMLFIENNLSDLTKKFYIEKSEKFNVNGDIIERAKLRTFISNKLKSKFNILNIEIECKECGLPKNINLFSFESSLFCSPKCSIKHSKIGKIKPIKKLKAPAKKVERKMYSYVCYYCNDTFEVSFKKNGNHTFCNADCFIKAKRSALNETIQPVSDETRIKIRNNILDRIASGKFTPKSSNRLIYNKIKFNNCNYRSTWEVLFHLVNDTTSYEKTRIVYNYDLMKKIYIVDFTDDISKILYEIKPSGVKSHAKCLAKETAAINYCNDIGYTFTYIHEDYFHKNSLSIRNVISSLHNDELKIILDNSLNGIIKNYENRKY